MTHPTQTESNAVHDALSEFHLTDADLRAAFAWIPDEHRRTGPTVRERFVWSVVANARAVDRSPYTVALFALDA